MKIRLQMILIVALHACACTCIVSGSGPSLPDPDGQSPDMTKPVKVYILMGQSNMYKQLVHNKLMLGVIVARVQGAEFD